MNIIDMFGDSMGKNSDLANKIAIKSELRKIERRSEDIVMQIENFIADESNFISKGLSYGYNPADVKSISNEDKEMLLNKLKEVSLSISGKVESSVNDLFDIKKEDKKEEDKKEEEKKEEKKEEEPEKKEDNVQATSNNKEKTVDQIQKEFESGAAFNPEGVTPASTAQVLTINPLEKFKYFGY